MLAQGTLISAFHAPTEKLKIDLNMAGGGRWQGSECAHRGLLWIRSMFYSQNSQDFQGWIVNSSLRFVTALSRISGQSVPETDTRGRPAPIPAQTGLIMQHALWLENAEPVN